MPSTIRLHRVFKTRPERLYKAFLEPEALVKFMPPHGFTAKVDKLEARVGGTYHMSFTNFSTGSSHSFGGEYLAGDSGPGVSSRSHSMRTLSIVLATLHVLSKRGNGGGARRRGNRRAVARFRR